MSRLSGAPGGGEEKEVELPSSAVFWHTHIWESHQPQDISQTNLTPITNEVFLLRHFGKYSYSLSCLELDEKIDTAVIFVR